LLAMLGGGSRRLLMRRLRVNFAPCRAVQKEMRCCLYFDMQINQIYIKREI